MKRKQIKTEIINVYPESLYPAFIKSLYEQEAARKGVVLLEEDFWKTVDALMQ